jgi:hypothetical protein
LLSLSEKIFVIRHFDVDDPNIALLLTLSTDTLQFNPNINGIFLKLSGDKSGQA